MLLVGGQSLIQSLLIIDFVMTALDGTATSILHSNINQNKSDFCKMILNKFQRYVVSHSDEELVFCYFVSPIRSTNYEFLVPRKPQNLYFTLPIRNSLSLKIFMII